MNRKLRVGVLFGGRSAEHEVSIQSAKSIIGAIDRERFDVVLLGIDRAGRWFLGHETAAILNDSHGFISGNEKDEVALIPRGDASNLLEIETSNTLEALDIVFPVLHGPYGEDGSIQGLLKLADLPYVGAGVLGSAVGMDKDVMKRLLRDGGISIAPFIVGIAGDDSAVLAKRGVEELGLPLFIKPANLGSSVGVTKAATLDDVSAGVALALQYDTKIIIEKYIDGREIECSVLGNRDPIASIAGEIKPSGEFYSYSAKYLDENGAELIIPAQIDEHTLGRIQQISIDAFKILCCHGMARVDMFLTTEHDIIVNEINTIPGFTTISMYPKLWEASGIPYTELITRLIHLGLEKFSGENYLKKTR